MTRIALACTVFACALPGQEIFQSRPVDNGPNGDLQAVFSSARMMPGQVVTGAPYSADQVADTTKTLSDGTHITTQRGNVTQHVTRDSEGRRRIERSVFGPVAAVNTPTIVQIYDPVAGFAYILDKQNKAAHRVAIQPPVRSVTPQGGGRGVGGGGGATVAVGTTSIVSTTDATHPNRPEISIEKLGSETIEGVVADGTRTTMTWPIGSHGNDRPLTNITESWFSKDLKLTVLSKSTDLRFGDNVTKLINISRAEPDASLFQPPSDYTVVDDKDSITLNLKRQ